LARIRHLGSIFGAADRSNADVDLSNAAGDLKRLQAKTAQS